MTGTQTVTTPILVVDRVNLTNFTPFDFDGGHITVTLRSQEGVIALSSYPGTYVFVDGPTDSLSGRRFYLGRGRPRNLHIETQAACHQPFYAYLLWEGL